MMKVSEVKSWIDNLPEDATVAIDDGGLTLVALDSNNAETEAYLEVGGIPIDED